MPEFPQSRFQQAFLLLLVLASSAAFVWIIGGFLEALFLAALSAVLLQPVRRSLGQQLGGRETLAAGLTLLLAVFIVVIPLMGLLGLLAAQAATLSEAVTPWVQRQIDSANGSLVSVLPDWLPGREALAPYEAQITAKLGEFTGSVGQFLVSGLSRITQGTVQFFLSLFVMLYALFYFLRSGSDLSRRMLVCVPMPADDREFLQQRVLSVIRATVKGTFAIGMLQGALAGLAFFLAGIQGAIFWGTVMAVLSIIPGIGAALVWVPAVIYLFVAGQVFAAAALGAWCAIVVGTADNVLRPRFVGKDTQMPDLLVLLSTLGGLSLFGIAGIILGPMIATIFIAVWGLYQKSFADQLGESRTTQGIG
jgi:predicted PurR-regulated permease PerM